jgi:hypothetical protein
MKPAGTTARAMNVTSSRAASIGFRANLIAIRFFTQESLMDLRAALHGRYWVVRATTGLT